MIFEYEILLEYYMNSPGNNLQSLICEVGFDLNQDDLTCWHYKIAFNILESINNFIPWVGVHKHMWKT